MHPTCPSSCRVNGTVWTCSGGVARLIDHKATSVFQRHCSHLASFVSAALNPTISVCFLLVAACTVERGLSSESNSVSGPPTPSGSAGGTLAFQCDPCSHGLTCTGLHPGKQAQMEHRRGLDLDWEWVQPISQPSAGPVEEGQGRLRAEGQRSTVRQVPPSTTPQCPRGRG